MLSVHVLSNSNVTTVPGELLETPYSFVSYNASRKAIRESAEAFNKLALSLKITKIGQSAAKAPVMVQGSTTRGLFPRSAQVSAKNQGAFNIFTPVILEVCNIVCPVTKVAECQRNTVGTQHKRGREGFARKILAVKPIGKGDIGRLRVRRKDVIAYYVTSNPNVIASQVRQMWVYPPDFYLTANILIEQKEIEQSTGDLLEDKHADG